MPEDTSTDQAYVQIPVGEKHPETQEELCFIAKPFVDDTWRLSLVIREAAGRLRLAAKDLLIDPNQATILTGSPSLIRHAKVVVAIIHKNDMEANANVMYELGVAHALGKPTLIFANTNEDRRHVPVMIRGVPLESLCPERELSTPQFREHLINLLTDKRRSEYLNLLWSDARPLGHSLPVKLITDNDFRGQVASLYDFARLIQAEFHQLSGKLTALTKPSLQQTMTLDAVSLTEFVKSFFDYRESFQRSTCVRDHSTLWDLFVKTQGALDAFCRSISDEKLDNAVHETFEAIRAVASGFPDIHSALVFDVRQTFEGSDDVNACLSLVERRIREKRIIHLPTALHAKSRRMLNTCVCLTSQAGLFLKQIAKALDITHRSI
jgi:hypothetical protein